MSVDLYFFPYAGAPEITFKEWSSLFGEEINFKQIVYSGHGNKRKIAYYSSIEEACVDIYNYLKKEINKDYYLVGHCLGALIIFELCYLIIDKKEIKLPKKIFLSGQGSPDRLKYENYHQMDNCELLEVLYKNKSIKEEFTDPDLYRIVKHLILEPIKAENYIYDNYSYCAKQYLLDIDCYILNGIHDEKYDIKEMMNWNFFINKEPIFIFFEGNHFFLNDNLKYITTIKNIILQDLESIKE